MPERIVAIHQPNFFPWLGYFAKILKADVFILLDDVQFPKKGGTWINRAKIQQYGAARFLSAPIDRDYSGTRLVNGMCFASGQNWRAKSVRALSATYGRATYFDEVMPLVEPLILDEEENIAEYNIKNIRVLVALMGLKQPEILRSSQLDSNNTGTERLVDLTRVVGGTVYLCGNGAGGYQDDDLFERAGLGLCYNNFTDTPYGQVNTNEFVQGLSVLDALFNVGASGVRALVEGG